jgi:hypothetical protein
MVDVPLEAQLFRYILHIIKHFPNLERSEKRHEDPMCNSPIVVAMLCCEETITGQRAQFINAACHEFVKSRFVTYFVEEIAATDHNLPVASDF